MNYENNPKQKPTPIFLSCSDGKFRGCLDCLKDLVVKEGIG